MAPHPAVSKPHRAALTYAPLSPQGPSATLQAWSNTINQQQIGRLAVGGCVYGGQTLALWGPIRDLLHLTDGPAGCGLYAHSGRPQSGSPMGIADFAGLNLGTDLQEPNIVFGTLGKLQRAASEAGQLFPLHRGLTLQATCPIALIGDDLEAAATSARRTLGQPAIAVPCAGFLRGDGAGATLKRILNTWFDWSRKDWKTRRDAYDVTLLCPELGGAWRPIVALLEHLGLHVVARWPGGADRRSMVRLGNSQLTLSVGMEYWAERLQDAFAQPWIAADFLGVTATSETLRRIAARFDERIQQQAASIIRTETPNAERFVASCSARLAGRLYLSFAPLDPRRIRAFTDFGLRVGSAQQG